MVPYEAAWGGRLASWEEMIVFEIISIVVNVGMALVVLAKMEWGGVRLPAKTTTILLWIMAGIFALNTLGNFFAVNIWERAIATPLTLISCILCYRLAVSK